MMGHGIPGGTSHACMASDGGDITTIQILLLQRERKKKIKIKMPMRDASTDLFVELAMSINNAYRPQGVLCIVQL